VTAAGVAVRPLSAYAHPPAAPETADGVRLVLGYAHVPPSRIAEGVRLMAEAATG
jgi:GntR family transcriptional regulator/MocR family aminotransferase